MRDPHDPDLEFHDDMLCEGYANVGSIWRLTMSIHNQVPKGFMIKKEYGYRPYICDPHDPDLRIHDDML
ncbi:hypothetical protein CEXT_355571 [Caerostris extrusa]|uniref:Uncharacterized protein n=1 Tax=Caerostris extrusa TaxID=172846 RepID=A0AAV4RF33_CAEEX|nr:hypothetical protein CEXT_355571 [Caerostris extrusa]